MYLLTRTPQSRIFQYLCNLDSGHSNGTGTGQVLMMSNDFFHQITSGYDAIQKKCVFLVFVGLKCDAKSFQFHKGKIPTKLVLIFKVSSSKVHVFYEGHTNLTKSLTFLYKQPIKTWEIWVPGDFVNFWELLRKYELYVHDCQVNKPIKCNLSEMTSYFDI